MGFNSIYGLFWATICTACHHSSPQIWRFIWNSGAAVFFDFFDFFDFFFSFHTNLFNFGVGLHIVPMIGPLHVSLNSRETVFLLNYDFFDLLFHAVFGRNKVLAKKPKPYKINLILEIAYQGWSRVRPIVMQKFKRSKDPEVRYLVNLLDNIVPLFLDFYPIIFRSGNWEAYI
ncbi:hypothetical protein C2G38_2136510 [Gigaspora rosea]|uniref:Uncharacterized protein n=1 Tax=Gigaspora rosea TaxID=44941 RepID=A0A397WCY4_9GLOM|nr:hypothetical protein C2G38_2136510 [Gigaspora rosea]